MTSQFEPASQTIPVQVEVLSPVHIGDGGELKKDFDFIVRNGRTWVIDGNRFAKWAFDQDANQDWFNTRPGDLLAHSNAADADVFRYQIKGAPDGSEIRSFEKNGFGQAYLPGSSLKGMLRTAFVWGLYTARSRQPDLHRIGKSRSFAGLPVERAVIGSDTYRDLFRSVHVRDSQPIDNANLRVVSVDIYPTSQNGQGGIITAVEAAGQGTVFATSLSIDRYGFRDRHASEIGWAGKKDWVDPVTIIQLACAFSEQRLKQELAYFKGRNNAGVVDSFVRGELVRRFNGLQENQFLAQIGWGTGWNSKTLNDLLTAHPDRFTAIVRDYRLQGKLSASFQTGMRFPASRHLIRSQGQPVSPMGWVLVTIG